MFAFLSIVIDVISRPVDRPRLKTARDAEASADGLSLRMLRGTDAIELAAAMLGCKSTDVDNG